MTTIKEIHTRTATHSPASFMLPDATAEYTASGSVLVFPLILPAIIAVAPNSPSPLANASTAPETTPGQAIGSYVNQEGNKVYATNVIVEEHYFAEGKKLSGSEKKEDTDPDGFMHLPDGEELPFE